MGQEMLVVFCFESRLAVAMYCVVLIVYDWSEICGRGFGYAMPHEIITAQVNQNNIDNISHQTTTTHTQINQSPHNINKILEYQRWYSWLIIA
jgi:hypothetical protein